MSATNQGKAGRRKEQRVRKRGIEREREGERVGGRGRSWPLQIVMSVHSVIFYFAVAH